MRYSQIRRLDISNGEGVGVALFTQGCHFHCKNCFNESTWDFNGGKEFTKEVEDYFYKLVDRPHIDRVTILGGEPLADENLETIDRLVANINKKIWVYTGNTFETLMSSDKYKSILNNIDVLVDGRYVDELRDLNLKFRGSSNQRIIDVKKSLKVGAVVSVQFN